MTDLCFLDGDQTQIYGQMAENLFLQRGSHGGHMLKTSSAPGLMTSSYNSWFRSWSL